MSTPESKGERRLTLHVRKLEGNAVVLFPEKLHDFLKVIDVFPRQPYLVVHQGRLDLELQPFDEFDHLLADFLRNAFLDEDVDLRRIVRGFFDFPAVEALRVHFEPGTLDDEHVHDGLDLHVVAGKDVNRLRFPVERYLGLDVFEVIPRDDFAFHIIDGIVQRLHVYLADYIDGWHDFLPA